MNKEEKMQKLIEFENALGDLITEMLPVSELTEDEIKEYFGDKTLAEYILEAKDEIKAFSRVTEQ